MIHRAKPFHKQHVYRLILFQILNLLLACPRNPRSRSPEKKPGVPGFTPHASSSFFKPLETAFRKKEGKIIGQTRQRIRHQTQPLKEMRGRMQKLAQHHFAISTMNGEHSEK